MTEHCCAPGHSNCIDSREAESLRDLLNVLNLRIADGYGAEFRKEAGETRLERIAHALERRALLPHVGVNYESLWNDLEDIDGRLQEIARGIPTCDRSVTCEDCQAIGEVKV